MVLEVSATGSREFARLTLGFGARVDFALSMNLDSMSADLAM